MKEAAARQQVLLKGKSVDEEKGTLQTSAGFSVTAEPIAVQKGETVCSEKAFCLYYYHPEIRAELMHTYTYDPDSNYTTYDRDLSVLTEIREWTADEACFIRLVFLTEKEQPLNEFVRFSGGKETIPVQKNCFRKEQQRMTERLSGIREDDDACFLLLADTHYGYGSVFADTVLNLTLLAQEIDPLAVIHLGDLTDGSQPAEISKEFVERVLQGLRECGLPLYLCIGNHDSNSFRGNPRAFDRKERENLYLSGEREDRRIDLPEKKLSLLFLSSYDPQREQRYGFSLQTVLNCYWMLKGKPKDYRLLIFSHVPPVGEMHFWDQHIHNSKWLLKVLENHQKNHHDILAYIHGHNHADSIYRKRSFPIVGIAANKPEDFKEYKPAGTFTPPRKAGDVSQECFDVLLVKKEKVCFLRYGAGEDRDL